MLRQSVVLILFGCALASPWPRAQHQYQQQQEAEGIPPHYLRQYLAQAQAQQQQVQPQATQVLTRPVYATAAAPAPTRLPYNIQSEPQYQPQAQYQPQPQHQPQPQPQYRPQPQYQAQRPQAQAQRDPQEDYDPSPSYQFGFDVNDDQYTNYQNRKEQRDGDVIKGSYSVVDSDGFIRTVTYTADPKEGFKAEVSRQPTDIVVKIPTPKPQTLHQQPQPVHHQPQQIQHQPQQAQRYVQQEQPSPQYYRYQQQ